MSALPRRAAALFFACGFFALLVQVFLLRELAIVFLGHELSFNLALASWLLWTGLGSFPKTAPAAAPGANSAPGTAGGEYTLPAATHPSRPICGLSLAAPLTLLAVRLAKLMTPFGRLPGVAEAFLAPLALLGPVCWAGGSVFRTAASRFEPRALYFLECAGASAAGLAATFLLAGRAPGFAVLAVGAAALASLNWFAFRRREAAVCAAACIVLAAFSGPIDAASRRAEWRGYRLLEQREGRYEHLAVAAAGSLRVVFQNGLVSAHFPDPSASEELVHWPLLAHPKPDRVLLVGVGATPVLAEVLKHPVERVDVVTADREELEAVRARLDPAAARAWSDPRVRLSESDPREWIARRPGAYEVILQLSPEPANASLNRLFTAEFFAEARRALLPGGILAFSIPSAENYLAPEAAYADASVWNALRLAFPHAEPVPGGRLILLGSGRPVQLEAGGLAAVYAARRISNQVLVPAQFPFYLMPERRQALLARLGELGGVPANADLRPVAYFLTWKVWLAKFVSPAHFLGLCLLAGAGLWGLSRLWMRRRGLFHPPENFAVFSLGLSGMSLEILLLLAFQVASGALYWKLGILLAAFMAGLSLGGGWGAVEEHVPSPKTPGGKAARRRLAGRLAILAAAELAAARSLPALAAIGASKALAAFGALLALDGLILGSAFPLACAVGAGGPASRPAEIYAADLWGSALGAFLTAAFLVPLAGMEASLLCAAAALAPAAAFLLSHR